MKTKYAFLTGFAMLAVTAAFAQVEHDDMYFNAKDRVAVNMVKQEVLATQYKKEDLQAAKVSPINPTDSYSGRSVNPEYTNRLKTNPNASDTDSQYFVSGYQPVSVNQNLASNKCNCTSNGYQNSPYNYNSFGGYGMNSFYGMNSGFGNPYSSFYSPFGMGGYYQPGWSSMMGYTMGGMNTGWYGGMSYGFGNSWGNPWSYGYGSSFSNYYGYGGGMPYGAYGYGYGSNYYNYGNAVVVNGGDNRSTTVYGKRSSRSSDTNNLTDHSRSQTSYTRSGQDVSSGRTRSSGSTQSQYYDRAWKSDPTKNTSRSYWSDNGSNTSNSNGSRSNWSNSWNNVSTGRQSSSADWGGSRSSGNSFSGGSTGGASHSGGGHSRGRD